jgi:hypothetical protein
MKQIPNNALLIMRKPFLLFEIAFSLLVFAPGFLHPPTVTEKPTVMVDEVVPPELVPVTVTA